MSLPDSPLAFLGVFAFPAAAGLLSGVSHCAAMCGPVHLFLARQGGRYLWAYHIGRVVTYAALGALAGFLAASLTIPGIAWVWVAVYAAMGLKLAGVPLWPASWETRYGGWLMVRLRPLTARVTSGGPAPLFGLGLAAGFLPCATTQAGLAWAVGTAGPATGAAGMLLLGAGTLPLFLAGPAAARLSGRFSGRFKWLGRFSSRGGRGWYHGALGAGLLALAVWKTYVLAFAPHPSCH